MRMSQLFLQTLRDAPGDARSEGFRLLLRAGFLRSLGSGCYAFLPLGAHVRQQLAQIAARAMTSIGGQQLDLPVVQPAELGAMLRSLASKTTPVHFRDRAQHSMVLETSNEASILTVASSIIQSYRQLPVVLYRIGPSFNDESGSMGELLGAREGHKLQAYCLHVDRDGLTEAYPRIERALAEVMDACQLGYRAVIAATDADGNPLARRWLLAEAAGDRSYVSCPRCGYAADQDIARVNKIYPAAEPLEQMQDVATPDCKSIAELCTFLGIPESRTAKAVFLVAGFEDRSDRFVFAVVRGDTALSEAKLKSALGATTLGFATESEIRETGAEPGYGSPVGLKNVTVLVDELAARSPNLVAGANRPGYHTVGVNHGRDYHATLVTDITLAVHGSGCPQCASPMALEQGVELGFLRECGDQAGRILGATYLDRDGRAQPIALGAYQLHLDRILAAAAEVHHDAKGLMWPKALTPYDVYLMTLGKALPEVELAAERLYSELTQAGATVLYDDRDERAGVKFNDADLLGVPLRVAVGDRGLKTGSVEVKPRSQTDVQLVPLDELVPFICKEAKSSC